MENFKKIAIFIPARMGSTRFYGKPLVDICGKTMIEHVYDIAMKTGCKNIYIATDSDEICRKSRDFGAKVIITDTGHQSGTDRIYEALDKIDGGDDFEIIINLQGDMPYFDYEILLQLMELFDDSKVDIGTLACKISKVSDIDNPNIVKAVAPLNGVGSNARALYFTRAKCPYGEGDYYHHIGIYGYRISALNRFVNLEQSYFEKREKLEQLRALEDGMHIRVLEVSTNPQGVDVPEDVKKIEKILNELD